MKRNYREILDRIDDEISIHFYDELATYREECLTAFEVLDQDYVDFGERGLHELGNLIKMIPEEVSVADPNIVSEFITITSKFYVDIKKDVPRYIRGEILDNFLDLLPNDLLIITNEIAFFSKITGALEADTEGTEYNGYLFYDVPPELRRSWVVDKHLKLVVEKNLVLKGDELDEEIQNCCDFLEYCSVMHGVSKIGIAKVRPYLRETTLFVNEDESEIETKFKKIKFSFKCDEKIFFIIYFSTIFQIIYNMQKKESYELVVYLYRLVFDRNDPLLNSEDKEELIKKRIKSEFGQRPNSESNQLKKIKLLAQLRVKAIRSIK